MRKRKLFLGVVIGLLFLLTGCVGAGMPAKMQGGEASPNSLETEGKMEVHYLDVGQGDATLIKVGEHAMLIDAGKNDQGTVVQDYLNSQKITSLDYAIGTHPDADHIGGLDVILYGFDCEKVIMPEIASETRTYEDVLLAMEAKNKERTDPVVGDTYSLGAASFTVVAPNADYGSDTNDWSVGILLEYGDNRFLFTGDAEEKAEEDMLSNGMSFQADVYKAAHHGSKTGSSAVFLDAVHPTYAVISCGMGNEYGHPHAQTLNEFRSRGIQVFRTDEQGTIVAVSDGENITFNMSPDESWRAGEPTGSSQKKNEDKTQTKGKEETKASEAKKKYVLNTNTMKFHTPDCRYVNSMEEENRKSTNDSRGKLMEKGYDPCGVCKP